MNRLKSVKSLLAMSLLALLSAGSLQMNAFADHHPDPLEHTIVTQGKGKITADPDSLQLSVRVQSKGKRMKDAREENTRKMNMIRSALKKLDIKNMTLKTQQFNVSPILEPYIKGKRIRKTIGYQVSNNLAVKITDATAENLGTYASNVLDTALDNGATHTGSLQFYIDDMTAVQAEALGKAVKDARRNADVMANAADVTIKEVYTIEGYPQYNYPRPVAMRSYAMGADMAESKAMSTPIEVGDTTVTSQVTVKFKF